MISRPSVYTESLLTLDGISGNPTQSKDLRFFQNHKIGLRRSHSKSVDNYIRSLPLNDSSKGSVILLATFPLQENEYICTVCRGPAQRPSSLRWVILVYIISRCFNYGKCCKTDIKSSSIIFGPSHNFYKF